MTFTPSPHQQSYFDWIETGEGSAILEAVAGAGKTTTILRGIPLMQRTRPGRIGVMVYNNSMGRELTEKVAAMGVRDVEVKTFHGAGHSALRAAFRGAEFTRRDPDDKKVLKIVEALVIEQDRPDLIGLEGAVAAIVSMAKQRGIGALCSITDTHAWEEMVDHFALDDSLPEGKEHMIPQLIKMGQICLRRSNEDLSVIDFDDMVYLPLQRSVRMPPWLQFDWLLVDEAQDTNPTRRALARKMLKAGGRLVAVGDPHQAIYGFTGTDNDSLDQIAQDFRATHLPLTTTYRCPKAVVRVARRFVSHIEAHETAPEGRVTEYDYSQIMTYARPGDAILCRYNKYLVSLVFKFIKAGVPAKIEGRAIGNGLAKLAGRWSSIKTLTALENKLAEHLDRQVRKAQEKRDERREEEARDLHETMMVLIARAREQGMTRIDELQSMIMGLFGDEVTSADMITLCSAHRSKGREWDRVHVLGLDEVMPGRCSREWQLSQEQNLQYVACTRAKQELLIVSGLREEPRDGVQGVHSGRR